MSFAGRCWTLPARQYQTLTSAGASIFAGVSGVGLSRAETWHIGPANQVEFDVVGPPWSSVHLCAALNTNEMIIGAAYNIPISDIICPCTFSFSRLAETI